MFNRRQFLKTSLAGGATALVSKDLQAAGVKVTPTASLKVDEVPRQKGKSVLGLRCKPLPTVRVGVVGLGRGGGAVTRMTQIEGTEIVAICDLREDRINRTQENLKRNGRKEAVVYKKDEEWRKMCERDAIDLIYNATPWDLHAPISLYAMDHGKHTALEVPAALTVKDCWALVDKA
jgi:hypothetical protein